MNFFGNTAFLITIAFVFAGCGIPDKRIKRKVAESEIVGVWDLDLSSSALLEDHDGQNYAIDSSKPHTIDFNADGTCRYRSVLQMPTRYVDAHGTWSIGTPSDAPKGSEIDLVINLPAGGTLAMTMDIKEKSGALVLWTFWSDPDLWNFLEYNKKAIR